MENGESPLAKVRPVCANNKDKHGRHNNFSFSSNNKYICSSNKIDKISIYIIMNNKKCGSNNNNYQNY